MRVIARQLNNKNSLTAIFALRLPRCLSGYLFGRPIFIQCRCWEEVRSLYEVSQTAAQYWIKIVHPWVQKCYPVLGWGLEKGSYGISRLQLCTGSISVCDKVLAPQKEKNRMCPTSWERLPWKDCKKMTHISSSEEQVPCEKCLANKASFMILL